MTFRAMQLKTLQNSLNVCSRELKELVTKRGLLGRKKRAIANKDLRKLVIAAGLNDKAAQGIDGAAAGQI